MKKVVPMVLVLVLCVAVENSMALVQVDSALGFGSVAVGDTATRTATVTNRQAAQYPNINVTISAIRLTKGFDAFTITGHSCPTTLNVGASCSITVSYSPVARMYESESVVDTGTLQIITAQEGTFNISLSGQAGKQFSLTTLMVDFGGVYVNQALTKSVQVTNGGSGAISLTVGGGSQVFQVSHNCGTLSGRGTCSINITFRPVSKGFASSYIQVSSSIQSLSIAVAGEGILDDDHPDISDTGTGCFIATAAYGSGFDPHVKTLQDFRDSILSMNWPGRAFIGWYYHASPPIADYVRESAFLKACVRLMLLPAVGFCALALTLGMIPTLMLLVVIGGLSLVALRRAYFRSNAL